jgi:hypothetical protein
MQPGHLSNCSWKNKLPMHEKKSDGRSTMKNTFSKTRGAYWIAIAAASLTFSTHAVLGARLMKETPTASVKQQAAKPQPAATSEASTTDLPFTAAYRDGLYVGKLAAQRGEQRPAPVGRWATQSDREAFLAGYEQSSAEVAESGQAELNQEN